MKSTICILVALFHIARGFAQEEEGRCGTVDATSGNPLAEIQQLINSTQDLVLVFVDFPDGRMQPGSLVPILDSHLDSVENIDAVGGMGWVRDEVFPDSLRKKARKYTYEDYWDWIFSEGEYYGPRHPDSTSHGILAYGSLKEYYAEVSYGNLTINPFRTWNISVEPTKYNTGIVNAIDTANGKKYVRWIMMPHPKSHYHPNGEPTAVLPVLDSLYRNGAIQFNRLSYTGKILVVTAGGGVGGVAEERRFIGVREKRYRNHESISTFDGIWIPVHEFGHTLRFEHMVHGSYDPMNFTFRNTWNQHLYCPPHFNPLLKWAAGWIPDSKVAKVRTDSTVGLIPIHTLPTAPSYLIALVTVYGDAGRDSNWSHGEYLMIEYRTREGFNRFSGGVSPSGGFGGGGLIWHYSFYPFQLGFNAGYNIALKAPGFFPFPELNFAGNSGSPSHFFYSAGQVLDSASTDPNSNSAANLVTGLSLQSFSISGNNLTFSVSYQRGPQPTYDHVVYSGMSNLPQAPISGRIYVQNTAAQVQILPGSVVDAAGSLRGPFEAVGTAQFPILFDGPGYGTQRVHGGYSFRELTSTARLRYCQIKNATIGVSLDGNPLAKVRLCSFIDCDNDIHVSGAARTVPPVDISGLDSNWFTNLHIFGKVKVAMADFTLQTGTTATFYPGAQGTIATLQADNRHVNIYGQLNIVSELKLTGNTFRFLTGLEVSPSSTLILSPSTTLEFADGHGVLIGGSLFAEGTSNQPVLFTRTGTSGSWNGIAATNCSPLSVSTLDYARIEHASTAVRIATNTRLTLTNSVIDDAEIGIEFAPSAQQCPVAPPHINISDNHLVNIRSFGIIINDYSNISLERNAIEGSCIECTEDRYGILCNNASPALLENRIHGFHYAMVNVSNSSPILQGVFRGGNNVFTENEVGFACDQSDAILGSITTHNPDGGQNSFVNGNVEAIISGGSEVLAANDWWGKDEDPSEKFLVDEESKIDPSPWLDRDPNESYRPLTQADPKVRLTMEDVEKGGVRGGRTTPGEDDLVRVIEMRTEERYAEALQTLREIVSQRTKPGWLRRWAVRQMLAVGQQLSDVHTSSYLLGLAAQHRELDHQIRSVLPSMYLHERRRSAALAFFNKNILENPNSPLERTALYETFLDKLYVEQSTTDAASILGTLMQRHSRTPETKLAVRQLQIAQSNRNRTSLAKAGNVTTTTQGTTLLPQEFVLNQNYPNPFNPTTTIKYELPVTAHVSLKLFDILGREVMSLVDEVKEAGSHQATLNAGQLASGIYFYRISAVGETSSRRDGQAGSFTQTHKLVLLR
ncbi:MAG: T9SS type A sorting domain-containing protein [Bacteroidetes bacterium]|nr:T9SS type A sorting domain-containing protein [Bacteroidota bacterium]MCW5894225.1 T9SS type A sorting domain-containing protein [Bacteroidota bacterium]